MSLLGTPVYANPTTPLWLGSGGSQTLSGNLTVGPPGFITGGRISASRQINPSFGNFVLSDSNGNTVGGLNQYGQTVALQGTTGQGILFGTVGTSNANSFLTLSAPGADLDLLRVGGTVRPNVFDTPDVSDNPAIRITGGAAGVGYIQGGTILFSEVNQSSANTSLVTSPFGSNADVFTTDEVNAKTLFLADAGAAPIVGTADITVASGLTYVIVNTTAVTATSKIFVSHAGASAAGPGNGAAQGGLTVNPALIVAGTSFRIDLVDPATGIAVLPTLVDVPVNWLIIG